MKTAALCAVLLLLPTASAAETAYKVSPEKGGDGIVFKTLEMAHDALALIEAGSMGAAAARVQCIVESESRLQVAGTDDRLFLRVLVLSGKSAGCKGYIVRSQVVRTDTETGVTTRVQ